MNIAPFAEPQHVTRSFPLPLEEYANGLGANAKMNEFQALMGPKILPYLSEIIVARRILTPSIHRDRATDSVRRICDILLPRLSGAP